MNINQWSPDVPHISPQTGELTTQLVNKLHFSFLAEKKPLVFKIAIIRCSASLNDTFSTRFRMDVQYFLWWANNFLDWFTVSICLISIMANYFLLKLFLTDKHVVGPFAGRAFSAIESDPPGTLWNRDVIDTATIDASPKISVSTMHRHNLACIDSNYLVTYSQDIWQNSLFHAMFVASRRHDTSRERSREVVGWCTAQERIHSNTNGRRQPHGIQI